MTMTSTREILEDLASGKLSVDDAEKALRILSLSKVGNIGMLDVNRGERSGVPEVVYAESKSLEYLVNIAEVMVEKKQFVMLTRMTQDKLTGLKSAHPELKFDAFGPDNHLTVLGYTEEWKEPQKKGKIAVVTAGTSDIPYAHEAEMIARLIGVEVLSFFDVGVAGIHRLIEPIKTIINEDVDAIVVFAGMEGALPTVVASLVDIPVIGVPVPTGYGFGGKGETALASMLQSCAPGLAVVNIGNGLGGGSVASLIAKKYAEKRK